MSRARMIGVVGVASVLLGAPGLVACSDGGVPSGALPVSVEAAPVDINVGGRSAVRPDRRIVVRTVKGTLAKVHVSAQTGGRVHGKYADARRRWVSTEPLAPSTTYSVDVKGDDGGPVTMASSFSTLTPRSTYGARVAPLTGETVGVGMPIAVYFTAEITDRAAVQRRFHVATSKAAPGAWHWYSDTEMHYRPRHYWPTGTDVSLTYDLRGIRAGKGTWSDDARTIDFSIGDSHVSRVDANAHTMKVYDNGRLIRTFPVSTGRDALPTSSGVHVVSEKSADQIMDSSTVGIPVDSPDGYYEHVPWSVRISNSGEFVHAAPWSVADQGSRNVSHGCVNMGVEAAKWFYYYSLRGDIVSVAGTSENLEQGNGFADWNLSWSDWVAGDALR